jgi:hypothetical protein
MTEPDYSDVDKKEAGPPDPRLKRELQEDA